jgi:protocatechuate 3,4-dioxygenase beta subunit
MRYETDSSARIELASRRVIESASRRLFLRQSAVALAGFAALPTALLGCSRQSGPSPASHAAGATTPSLGWSAWIGTDAESGEPLVVSGTIYGADGRTPLAGSTLHVYHTDARGLYGGASGNPRESARLRGRMLTGRDGRYEFRTIRPASYPGNTIPAHIHVSVAAPNAAERWIADYWFEDDPLLPRRERERHAGAGAFSPIMMLKRDAAGAWRGARDIRAV